ncbi:MAG: DUF7289 family protein [Candidatus Alkanophagales archaeon]
MKGVIRAEPCARGAEGARGGVPSRFRPQTRPNMDKGVSEVIGYILMFSAVMTVVAVVYVGGMPLIEKTQEESVFQSMETVFFNIQSNIEKVALGQSPSRTIEVKVSEGSLFLSDGGWMRIDWGDGASTYSKNFTYQSLVFSLGGHEIAYENGAVIEAFPGSIIVSKPKITSLNVDGEKYLYVSIINVSGAFSAGGGVAELTITPYPDEANATEVVAHTQVDYVSISVGGKYSSAWIYYLEEVNATFNGKPFSPPPPSKRFVNFSSSPPFNFMLVVHNVTIR